MNLFRKEALAGKRVRIEGDVMLTQPISYTAMTMLMVMIVVVTITFLVFHTYARKETVRGFVLTKSGSAKLFVNRIGLVDGVFAKDGQRVSKGDKLFFISHEETLSDNSPMSKQLARQVDEKIAILNRQLEVLVLEENIQNASLKTSIDSLDIEITQYKNELLLRQKSLEAIQAKERKLYFLENKDLIAADTLIQIQQSIRSTQVALQQRKALVTEKESMRRRLQHQADGLVNTFEKERLVLKERLINLSTRNTEMSGRSGIIISAPIDGIVTSLQITEGQRVTPNVVLAAIEPENPEFQAIAYAPSTAIGFISPSQSVNLMYDAFPYQRFGVFTAKVLNVSDTTLLPAELTGPIETNQPTYRIVMSIEEQRIDTYNKKLSLQDGMLFTADILLEERSLTEWVLEPLLSLSRR